MPVVLRYRAVCCAVCCAQLDLYYNGFCNSVLWQLFHYVPLNIDTFQKMAEHRAMQMQWQAYQVGGLEGGLRGAGARG